VALLYGSYTKQEADELIKTAWIKWWFSLVLVGIFLFVAVILWNPLSFIALVAAAISFLWGATIWLTLKQIRKDMNDAFG